MPEQQRLAQALAPYRISDIRHHTLSSISALLIESKAPRIDRKIQLVDNQYFERSDGNIRGLVATVQATELVKMISNPDRPDEVLLDIFDDNVRVYLTSSNRINAKIIESALSEENATFWYLNNGITMTCDFMEYPPGVRAPTLLLENVQIVNGGQTSHALFEAARREPDRVKNVLVLVRVYQTKQREISLRIAASGEDYDVDLLFLIDGAFHLLYAVSHLCELRGIDPTDAARAVTQLDDGVRVLKKAVVEEQQQDVAFAHKRFFKSERARARIHKAAAELVEQDANPLFQRPA